MTILSVVQNVCLAVGLERPDQVFASTDREMLEMARLSNTVGKSIARVFGWQALLAIRTFNGDGVTEAFDLPVDYDRMLPNSSLWSSRFQWQFTHITSPDEWLEYQVYPYNLVSGNWIIFGGQIHVLPVMATGETLKFFYVTKTAVTPSAGARKETFTADTDTFALSEYLLELGMIWRWRAKEGLPYAEDKLNYEIELNNLMDKDGGSKPVVRAKGPTWMNGGTWPGVVGGNVPDALPDGYSILIGKDT